jgi:transcriptional regulator with XRE-family HTH domain
LLNLNEGGVEVEQLDKQIGEKLREIREKKGFTMRQVAEIIDIDYSYISKIEKGKIPSLDKLNKLCDLYGITVASLFGEEVKTPKELEEVGVEWISFAKEMEKKDITPEEIKQIMTALKLMNKL